MIAYGVASNPPFEAGLAQGTDKRPTTEIPPSVASHLNIVYIPMEIENCGATYSDQQRPAGTFPALSSSTGEAGATGARISFVASRSRLPVAAMFQSLSNIASATKPFSPQASRIAMPPRNSSRPTLIAMESMPNGLGLSADPQAGIWWG